MVAEANAIWTILEGQAEEVQLQVYNKLKPLFEEKATMIVQANPQRKKKTYREEIEEMKSMLIDTGRYLPPTAGDLMKN